jgi:hypothetical protein
MNTLTGKKNSLQKFFGMKNKILFILSFVALNTFAQTPQKINYQGIARNNDGSAIANKTISVQFELKQSAASVFSETQTIITNSLGLFSTQIGKNGLLSTVNWEGGDLFLQISIDPDGGNNFLNIGQQQLVSVPYALHAGSVPATYSNGILSIGNKSFTLATAGTTYSAGNGIAISSGSIINTAPDVPLSIVPGINLNMNGTYPNYSISSTPSLALSGNSLSISGGNTLLLPSIANVSLTGSGAVALSTLTANSFSINVPPVSLTQSGGIGTITSTGTNSFDIDIPAPFYNASTGLLTTGTVVTNITQSLSLTGNTLSSGPATNSVILPINNTITGTGIAVVTPSTGTNFTISVAQPTFAYSNTTGSLSSGSVSAFITPTLNFSGGVLSSGPLSNSVIIPGQTNPIITPSGIISVTPVGSSFTVGAIQPSLTGSGITTVSGTYPNQMVNTPLPVFTGLGTSTVSGTYPNYIINTPAPSFSTVGSITVSGSFPNYTLSAPAPQLTSLTGSGAAVVTPTSGNAFTINVAPTNITATTGIATINSPGTNSFNINVPAPSYNNTTGILTNGPSTIAITPILTITNNILSSGPLSNSVNLGVLSPWAKNGSTVTLANTSDFVGIGTTAPVAKLEVISTQTTSGIFSHLTRLNFNPITNSGGVASAGYFVNYFNGIGGAQINTGLTGYLNLAGSSTSQYNTGGWLHGVTFTGTHTNLIGAMGSLEVYSPGVVTNAYAGYFEHLASTGVVTNGYGIYTGLIGGINKWSVYASDATAPSYFAGRVGIGTTSPSVPLHVVGTARIADGTQGVGKVLTSDALGNASWQTSSAVSKVRSIIVDPNMIDINILGAAPSKVAVGGWLRPCINFPDGSTTQIASNLPVPKDWNGASSMTLTVFYSSPLIVGSYYFLIGVSGIGLNTSAVSPTSGPNQILPVSLTAEGLQETTHIFTPAASDKVIEIYLQRQGGHLLDTSLSPMHMWGYRLDYND